MSVDKKQAVRHESEGLLYGVRSIALLIDDAGHQCLRYDIEDLAEQGDFLDNAHLLLMGELPTSQQKAEFDRELTMHTLVHEQLIQFFRGFKHDAHPMAIMVGVVGALAAFEPYSADLACAGLRLDHHTTLPSLPHSLKLPRTHPGAF